KDADCESRRERLGRVPRRALLPGRRRGQLLVQQPCPAPLQRDAQGRGGSERYSGTRAWRHLAQAFEERPRLTALRGGLAFDEWATRLRGGRQFSNSLLEATNAPPGDTARRVAASLLRERPPHAWPLSTHART